MAPRHPSKQTTARRNHFVPRGYLRGFTDPSSPERIWVYRRPSGDVFASNISDVGLERDFYPPEIETQLADVVDSPGAEVLQVLRQRQVLQPEHKSTLAYFIAVQLMRVPEHRKSLDARMSAALAELEQEHHNAAQLSQPDSDPDAVAAVKLHEECLRVIDRYKTGGVPADLIATFKEPWPYETMVRAVGSMRWVFVVAPAGSHGFVTSDNPAFFFRGLGLGRPESELTVPISTSVCLHGSHTPGPDLSYLAGSKQWVNEVNRRVTSACTRHVYFSANELWLKSLVMKKHLYTQAVRWR
jgi:hypothetical protein